MLKADAIINSDQDNSEDIFNIEKEILEQETPNIWNINHEDNMERGLEIEFEKFALAIIEQSNLDIYQVTVKTFYAKVEQLKEKHKNNN